MRTRVIFALGRAASARRGRNRAAAGAAVSDLRKALRFMSVAILGDDCTPALLLAHDAGALRHGRRQRPYAVDAGANAVAGLDARALGTARRDQIAGIERHVVAVKAPQLEGPGSH